MRSPPEKDRGQGDPTRETDGRDQRQPTVLPQKRSEVVSFMKMGQTSISMVNLWIIYG